ncbi:hypothetical protein F441_05196 [Phytophthora nicotianae CJ01A1]|uniref:Pesticidal crystal protein central domain-containing protein n=1 Tax=Phytophthora nicotianae CJ01A1 TaxID=1317063 RepID=W2XFH1_PHYNI|nr:hypothetical protein F441_05196 [Phytophthora nicotianae CJ01A1]
MKQFLQVQFDESEREMIREKQFSINVHEQLSEVFALFYNKSAVSWCNSLSSREPLAQEQNRVLGALEARLGLRVSAEHLPGASNYLADLGSQGWSGTGLTRRPQDLLQHLVVLQQSSLAESSLRQYAITWKQWTIEHG